MLSTLSLRTQKSTNALRWLVPTLFLLGGCSEKKPAAAPAPPPDVEVVEVEQRDVPIFAEWLGTVDGFVNAQIRAQVTGYLMRQVYTEGKEVKKGDLLFEIDPRTFQANYDEVKANFDKTVLDINRTTKLAADNVVSKQDLDNALAANLSAKAMLSQSQLNLDFTKILSPIDGIAGIATAQIGNLVGPGTGELTTVSTLNPAKVYFTISEQSYLQFSSQHPDTAKFENELEMELVLSDGSVYPQKGKFFAADRQVDIRTGSLRLAAVFPNPNYLLRPGQYGRVRAVIRTQKGALLVPQRSVSELQGTFQVITVGEDNKAHIVNVKPLERIGPDWIVEGDLKAKDRVVIEGLQKAKDGGQVNPKPYHRPAAQKT